MGTKTLLVATEKRFYKNHNNSIVDIDNTRSYTFWSRYLDVFDRVIVIGRVNNIKLIDNTHYVEGNNIEVYSLPYYQGIFGTLRFYRKIKSEIKKLFNNINQPYILLRLPGTIGNIIADYCNNNKLNYSVEIVGDPFELFKCQKSPMFFFLAVYQRKTLQNIVKKATSASYVTKKHLQNIYPLKNGFTTHYSSICLNSHFFSIKSFYHIPYLSLIGIGNLDFPYKGVNILLKALKKLSKNKIDYKLTWIGTGKLIDNFKKLTIKYKIQNNINFVGSIPNEKIPIYLEQNNIFILPSIGGEGLPRALIEAMASSLICLGSRVGGIPELLTSECIFKPNNPNEIYKLLKHVNDNFSYYTKYSLINYNKAKEYLPKYLENKRIEFYKTIIPN